jgi:hypothetical protein
MNVTRGTGTTNPSGAPEFILVVLGFVLLFDRYCFLCRSLFVLLFLFFLYVLLGFTYDVTPFGIFILVFQLKRPGRLEQHKSRKNV